MFNKEESKKVKKVKMGKVTFKKIGSFLLTLTMLIYLSVHTLAETNSSSIDDVVSHQVVSSEAERSCDTETYNYFNRVIDFEETREYDENIVNLYYKGKVSINGNIYDLRYLRIAYTQVGENFQFYLQDTDSMNDDILDGKNYLFRSAVSLRDTTAFIELINDESVTIDYENNIIIVNDINRLREIIQNWNGMLHDSVSAMDAVEEKYVLR